MAQVKIINARVGRVIPGKGFVAVETYVTRQGDQRENKFTVWTENPSQIPGENSLVNVEGNLSTRVEEYNGNHYVKTHINQPKIIMVDTPREPEIQQAPDTWTNGFDSEAPF